MTWKGVDRFCDPDSTGAPGRPQTQSSRECSGRAQAVIDHGIGFDFNEPVPVNEACDLHYGASRPYACKIFAMDPGHRRPILDASEQNPGSHDMAQRRVCGFESSRDNFQAAMRLHGGVSPPDSAAIRSNRRGTRDRHNRTGPYRSRKSNVCLIWATTRDELAHELPRIADVFSGR